MFGVVINLGANISPLFKLKLQVGDNSLVLICVIVFVFSPNFCGENIFVSA